MKNKYRLSSNAFDRETEEQKQNPKKIFFLSVEGNLTEKEYFEGVSANRNRLGINALVDVEVLKRSSKDTNCAPQQVVELLEEYLRLRELGKESLIKDIPESFVKKYGIDFIEKFLNESLDVSQKRKNAFITDLRTIGYDINYRKYLSAYNEDLDEFGILIDRDMNNHSEDDMIRCIQHCITHNYNCYISNPCFEFWLLLHLSDVKSEYRAELDKIQKNLKVSNKHTFVSNEVSKIAHHGKSGIAFREKYLPHIDDAIQRAKDFETDELELVNHIGCNIYKLIEAMKNYSH